MIVTDELTVVKRSGQRVGFNGPKIAIAIKKAFDSVEINSNEKSVNKVYEDVLIYINDSYVGRKTINVEDIQDIIEKKLLEHKYHEVYNSFNEYRLRRAESRKAFSIKQQHKFVKAIERIAKDYSSKTEQALKPNDILLDFGKTVSSEFTKAYVLDSKSYRAHEEGNIYIHDLDYFNLGMLHSLHLKINNTSLIKNFPYEFTNSCLDLKEEIDGEISMCSMDKRLTMWLISNYNEIFKNNIKIYLDALGIIDYINISKLEKTIDNQNTIKFNIGLYDSFILNDKMKSIFDNVYKKSINELSELVDVSLKYFFETLNNNHKENKKYSISFGTGKSYEAEYINKKIIEVVGSLGYLENVIIVYKFRKNSDLNDSVTKLIFNGHNVALNFVDASFNKNDSNEVEYFGNGKRVFENINASEKSSIGRMIVATTSINLSRLGFKYENKPIKDFYLELDEKLELIKNQLLLSFETIGDKSKDNYRMLFSGNVLDDEKLEDNQKIRKVIKNGVINISVAGLKECALNLSDNPYEITIDILKHINKICAKMSNETKLNFVLTETSKHKPLKELIAIDKTIYGIRKNITDKDCYTKVDSLFDYKNNLIDSIQKMANIQKLLTGGNNFMIRLSNKTSLTKIEEMIKIMSDNNIGFVKFSKDINYDN